MQINTNELVKALFGNQIKEWLHDRVLHVPEAKVVEEAHKIGLSEKQWRAVEAVIAGIADAAIDAL